MSPWRWCGGRRHWLVPALAFSCCTHAAMGPDVDPVPGTAAGARAGAGSASRPIGFPTRRVPDDSATYALITATSSASAAKAATRRPRDRRGAPEARFGSGDAIVTGVRRRVQVPVEGRYMIAQGSRAGPTALWRAGMPAHWAHRALSFVAGVRVAASQPQTQEQQWLDARRTSSSPCP